MTGNSARHLHGYLQTFRSLQAASAEQAWKAVLAIEDPATLTIAMTQMGELLDDTVRSIRAADGIINADTKLVYLPAWRDPIYGWNWPGNGGVVNLAAYPSQAAVDVLDGVADTFAAYFQDDGLDDTTRESLLGDLLQLRQDIQMRVSDPAARLYLLDQLQRLIDGLSAPGVRGAAAVADMAAAAAVQLDQLAEDSRLNEGDRSWAHQTYDVALRVAHFTGLGATVFLGLRHDPVSAALTFAAAKNAFATLYRNASPSTLKRLRELGQSGDEIAQSSRAEIEAKADGQHDAIQSQPE